MQLVANETFFIFNTTSTPAPTPIEIDKQKSIEDALLYPTVMLEILSFFCSFLVMISAFRLWRSRISTNPRSIDGNDRTFLNLIFWLCLMDCFEDIIAAFNIGYEWSSNYPKTTPLCVMYGALQQFISMLISFWQMLIASFLFYLLVIAPKKNWKYLQSRGIYNIMCLIIFILTVITTAAPFNFNGKTYYKSYPAYISHHSKKFHRGKETRLYDIECWCTNGFEMIYYISAIIAILFHLLNLIIAIIKYFQHRHHNYKREYWKIIQRLLPWPVGYICLLTLSITIKTMGFLDDSFDPPFVVVQIHRYLLACTGIVNGFIWISIRAQVNNDIANQQEQFSVLNSLMTAPKTRTELSTEDSQDLLWKSLNRDNDYEESNFTETSVTDFDHHPIEP